MEKLIAFSGATLCEAEVEIALPKGGMVNFKEEWRQLLAKSWGVQAKEVHVMTPKEYEEANRIANL